MEKIEKSSEDQIKVNIAKLKDFFPEVFIDGKINKQVLLENLGEHIDSEFEKYNFFWSGKSQSRKIALTPSTATLRPVATKSIEWQIAENLFIEGDNLEVLKLLQKSYHERIKCIYIDPPYNTGKEFVYRDNYKDNLKTYLKYTGQENEKGLKMSSNQESGGRFHTNWLNMMYPRLKLARNLLRPDGFIFISIDDNEYANLKKVCDEIFGEENFFSSIVVRSNSRGQTYKQIAKTHEYILIYTKSDLGELYELKKDEDSHDLNFQDELGAFSVRILRNTNPQFGRHNRPNLFYPIYVDKSSEDASGFYRVSLEKTGKFREEVLPLNSQGKEGCWRWGKAKCVENIKARSEVSHLVGKRKSDGSFGVYEKYRKMTYKPKSIWTDNSFLTDKGTTVTKELGFEGLFEFPKPPDLIKECLKLSTRGDDIVLDFFAGSSSTAQATLELNEEDGGCREFIMVQLPEECRSGTAAAKAGYRTISELSLQRIKKVMSVGPSKDVGLKVFKLDSTNVKEWDVEDNEI